MMSLYETSCIHEEARVLTRDERLRILCAALNEAPGPERARLLAGIAAIILKPQPGFGRQVTG